MKHRNITTVSRWKDAMFRYKYLRVCFAKNENIYASSRLLSPFVSSFLRVLGLSGEDKAKGTRRREGEFLDLRCHRDIEHGDLPRFRLAAPPHPH
jgi:hypothetical protein